MLPSLNDPGPLRNAEWAADCPQGLAASSLRQCGQAQQSSAAGQCAGAGRAASGLLCFSVHLPQAGRWREKDLEPFCNAGLSGCITCACVEGEDEVTISPADLHLNPGPLHDTCVTWFGFCLPQLSSHGGRVTIIVPASQGAEVLT